MRKGDSSFVRVPRKARVEVPGKVEETEDNSRGEIRPVKRLDSHERIVVPRQSRGREQANGLDVELREVRYGAASKGPYLRVVPKRQRLTSVAPGHIEATRAGSVPLGPMGRAIAGAKGIVLGAPMATAQGIHERLSNVKALAVLGSDPLSSSAYATEEALIILVLAGSAALVYSIPIALAVALLMTIVVISYRQTQKAYPSGGGAYIVAHENLGAVPGFVAGAALIVDYVLLVSVSVAAGVAAITSAVPELFDWRVPIAIVVIILFTLGNLRGIRESGSIFSAPTYFFILMMGGVIAIGLVKVAIGDAPGSLLHAAPPTEEIVATQGITLWLVLRAFASGGAALTGVEAMSNNIPNFKPPESENARKTLTIMAIIAIYLFLGITFLTSRFGLIPTEEETIVSQLGRAVLGENPMYFAYQASTAMVLFLAANTSFYDFPLLSAILARDRCMPRQFAFRGDRLAYSNGILVLSGLAVLLLVVFQADTTRLIPLYAVGVFVSFTLSQSGMVRHWLRVKEPGWKASLVMNGTGALATGVVAVIVGATKFTHGAWISLIMMGVLVLLFALIRRHYRWFEDKVRMDEDAAATPAILARPLEAGSGRDHVVVPVDDVNKVTLAAVALAREISPVITAVHLTDDREAAERFRGRWERAVPDVPLLVIESPYRAFAAPMVALLQRLRDSEPAKTIRVILPAFGIRHWWERFLHNRDVQRLERALVDEPGVETLAFTYELK